jgi:hypothetical protein
LRNGGRSGLPIDRFPGTGHRRLWSAYPDLI